MLPSHAALAPNRGNSTLLRTKNGWSALWAWQTASKDARVEGRDDVRGVRTENVAEAASQRFAGTASMKLAGLIIAFPCRRNRWK